jgi:cytochrome c-type biogenesis protein CcsB
MTVEIVLMWAALTIYVIATAHFVFGVTLEKEKFVRRGVVIAALGTVPHIASLAVRWARIGHGPYLGFYEVTSALTLCAVLFYLFAAWRRPALGTLGIAVMPVALLLVGASMLAPKSGMPITPTLASYWLVIHVLFSDLAFAAFVISYAFSLTYIIRERSRSKTVDAETGEVVIGPPGSGPYAHKLERMPEQDVLDHRSARFIYAGFLFWGAMIASGAIWANEAWGRYWGWDPIETWSLIVWIVYAVYLHLRITLGWRGQKINWVAVIAMPVCLFCLIGIPFVFHSIHGAYLR